MDDHQLLQTAEEAARLAGSILLDWAAKFTVSEKGPANLVTEADFASQQAIFDLIRGRFPDHHFLGEESLDHTEGDSPYRWVIDPLDGTTNYVHGFPYYAVSIGLECAGELTIGVIYDPNRNELFSAAKGQGTTLNGSAVHPTNTPRVSEAMLMASLPVGVGSSDPAIDRFLRVLPQSQTVQRSGSAALNLAYVACGRIDGFWSNSLKPWDMAAGVVIVREAGGQITKMDGSDFELSQSDLLSSNGTEIHQELQQLLSL